MKLSFEKKDWLKAEKLVKAGGQRIDPRTCPVACSLKRTNKKGGIVVSYITILAGGAEYSTPVKVQDVMSAWDVGKEFPGKLVINLERRK